MTVTIPAWLLWCGKAVGYAVVGNLILAVVAFIGIALLFLWTYRGGIWPG